MRRYLLILFILVAVMAQAQNKPYITKVYDFMPAPGQFVNKAPSLNPGEPRDSVIARVERMICGRETIEQGELPDGSLVSDTILEVKPGVLSLGSFGGYVIFGFDHPVVNVKGEYDLQIFANASQANNSSSAGGSSEPGVVMVSRDVNGNGIPDDPWYELAGSEYNNPKTQKHFTITYYKPDENKTPVPEPPFITDAEYIRWTCNSVDSLQEGYIRKNSFNTQSYWPAWAEGETLTFEGTKLPCNAVDESGQGSYYVQHFFDWGYVDNRPDNSYGYYTDVTTAVLNDGFNLDWAVDDEGNPVELKQVDFIKVYCAELQDCGWLGETSTEVCGAIDLHPNAVAKPEVVPGDVNGDGECTGSDVTALYNFILYNDSSSIVNGDQNDDGDITGSDVTAVYNIILY